jgi:hypothetical protein
MKKLFGSREYFGIEVEYNVDVTAEDILFKKYPNDSYDNEAEAQVKFWVKGKNLFSYDIPEDDDATYWHELNDLVEFFSENLIFHITRDNFPFKTQAIHAHDIKTEVFPFEPGEEGMRKLFEYKSNHEYTEEEEKNEENAMEWFARHGFGIYATFSRLPQMYFQKVGDQVEISWNKTHPFGSAEGDFWPIYKKGLEFIEITTYSDVILAFCCNFCDRLRDKQPKVIEQFEKNIAAVKIIKSKI